MDLEHILVVDDEPAFRELMQSHLQRHGYSVQAAGDGREAIQALQTAGHFAVMVTDLAMPNMGGLDLLREARRFDPQLEVIVISATDTVETAIAAMREYGAYDFLRKPLEPVSELSVAVRRAADYRRLRLEREALQAQIAGEAQRLRTLIANTSDAILSADAQGTLRVANPAAERLLGQGQLIGTPAAQSLPPHLTRLVANWEAVGNHQPVVVEIPWSETTTYLLSLTPLPGGHSQGEGWVMVIHDITLLKQLEGLQMRLLTEAANKIQLPLTQALGTLVEISQMAEVQHGRPMESVYRLGTLLSRIREWMDELLIVARIEAGLGIQPISMDVTELVQEWVCTFNEKRSPDKTTRLTVTMGRDVPLVYADRDLMRRMLQQAIGQALSKAKTKTGGEIHVTVDCHQGQVWIGVMDPAPSTLAAEAPCQITQAGVTSRLKPERAGQELNMVKAIVHRMGGQVWTRGQDTLAICLPAMSSSNAK